MPPIAPRTVSLTAISVQTRNTFLVACIAVALLVATVLISYLVFKALRGAKWFNRDQRDQANSTPGSISTPTTGSPTMKAGQDLFVQGGYPSTSTLGSGYKPPSRIIGPPPPIPSASPGATASRWQNLGSRFHFPTSRSTHQPQPSKLRPSKSSPSVTPTPPWKFPGEETPPLPSMMHNGTIRIPPRRPPRNAYTIQGAAETVVGAHPYPMAISPPMTYRLPSPTLGKFQIGFPWVTEDVSFGLVAPGSQAAGTPTITTPSSSSSPDRTVPPQNHSMHQPQATSQPHQSPPRLVRHPTMPRVISNANMIRVDRASSPPPLLEDHGKYPKPALPSKVGSRSRRNLRDEPGGRGRGVVTARLYPTFSPGNKENIGL